jgi:hypothetical protein
MRNSLRDSCKPFLLGPYSTSKNVVVKKTASAGAEAVFGRMKSVYNRRSAPASIETVKTIIAYS